MNSNKEILKLKNDAFIQRVCKIIQEKRTNLKLDQSWVAHEVGIHQSRLSDIENGKITDFKISQLNRLMEVLNIQYEEILEIEKISFNNNKNTKNNVIGEHIKIEKTKKVKLKKIEEQIKNMQYLLEENNALRVKNNELLQENNNLQDKKNL